MAQQSRLATPDDAPSIASIYNAGISEGNSTFETRPRSPQDISAWFDGKHPIVVVLEEDTVIAFASTSSYRPRECYAGIAEYSVYVAPEHRGKGAGKRAMQALLIEAEKAGFWKLVSRIFVENRVSRQLMAGLGFREVGIYERHGRLNGVWRDVVIVEYLFPANLSAE